jgi:BlaI family penicillinase repressor
LKVGQIGKLQLAILEVLWRHPGATVQTVQSRVRSARPLAYTTIATMLKKMEARGLVTHEQDGRFFKYRAAVTREELSSGVVQDVLGALFAGSLPSLVSHLLTQDQVSRKDLDALEALIAEKKRKP